VALSYRVLPGTLVLTVCAGLVSLVFYQGSQAPNRWIHLLDEMETSNLIDHRYDVLLAGAFRAIANEEVSFQGRSAKNSIDLRVVDDLRCTSSFRSARLQAFCEALKDNTITLPGGTLVFASSYLDLLSKYIATDYRAVQLGLHANYRAVTDGRPARLEQYRIESKVRDVSRLGYRDARVNFGPAEAITEIDSVLETECRSGGFGCAKTASEIFERWFIDAMTVVATHELRHVEQEDELRGFKRIWELARSGSVRRLGVRLEDEADAAGREAIVKNLGVLKNAPEDLDVIETAQARLIPLTIWRDAVLERVFNGLRGSKAADLLYGFSTAPCNTDSDEAEPLAAWSLDLPLLTEEETKTVKERLGEFQSRVHSHNLVRTLSTASDLYTHVDGNSSPSLSSGAAEGVEWIELFRPLLNLVEDAQSSTVPYYWADLPAIHEWSEFDALLGSFDTKEHGASCGTGVVCVIGWSSNGSLLEVGGTSQGLLFARMRIPLNENGLDYYRDQYLRIVEPFAPLLAQPSFERAASDITECGRHYFLSHRVGADLEIRTDRSGTNLYVLYRRRPSPYDSLL
jgi:hypothetical protein